MEKLIDLETAKLIPEPKKSAYWNQCFWFYIDTTHKDGYFMARRNDLDIDYPRPTQSLAQKYLREEKKMHVKADINLNTGKWFFTAVHLELKHFCLKSISIFDSYELALEAGLQETLKIS